MIEKCAATLKPSTIQDMKLRRDGLRLSIQDVSNRISTDQRLLDVLKKQEEALSLVIIQSSFVTESETAK